MGSSASLGGASLSLVAAAALCGCARRGGTFATAAHYDVTNRNTRRLLRGRHIRELQFDFDPADDFPPLDVPTDQTIPMEQMEPNFDPTAGIPGMPDIPNTDMLEPPGMDPADPQFDPDDTTGIPGMDMLPPGSEGSEQSPTDPSSSEVNYDPSEEELQMQEILKLEAEQIKAMPEGWDPNNPKASLDALEDQNTVPSEETELGASMSEEEAYQGDPLMNDDPIFDDPMYDPNSPEFDEAALAELDEESLSILAEKYGDEIMDKLPDGPPLEEEPIENEFDSTDPMYDPSSPEFDEAALGELDEESLSTLADMYGDEFRDKLPEELEEEPIENEFDSTDPMYDPSSPEFDELALGELDEESLATLAEKYGDEIMEYGDEGELGEDQLDPTNDPSLDTINFNDPKYDHNSAFYDPEAVNELSDADKVLIEKMYGKITYEEPAYEDEITPIEDPMDPAYDPAEEPFDELGDPGDDLDEAQMEEYEDTADMATASPPPLADMPTSATGMPPGAEIGQEPNWDPAFTPAPVGEGEDEMNLYPEDEPGYPEDEPGPGEDVEEKWGLENEWPLGPTDKPTPRPTVLYVPYDYDESPEEGTAVEAGDAGDEVFYHGLEPQIGPVGKYLDGVGSPEEIEEDKNVQVVGGVLLALFLVLVLVTAHSVMNNPDGLCAGCCRLTLQIICCFTRVLCLPCRALCCRDEQGRGRRTHAPMRTPFPSDLELS